MTLAEAVKLQAVDDRTLKQRARWRKSYWKRRDRINRLRRERNAWSCSDCKSDRFTGPHGRRAAERHAILAWHEVSNGVSVISPKKSRDGQIWLLEQILKKVPS